MQGKESKKGLIQITGVADSRLAPVIATTLKKEERGQCLIVTSSQIRAKRLATDLSFFVTQNTYLLPPAEERLLRYEARDHDDLLKRLQILKALRTGENCIVVASVAAAIRKLPPAESFDSNAIHMTVGEEIDIESVKSKLIFMGYERVPLVDNKGQFSLRGSILDIFTPDGELPRRVEFFDTQIDSIRSFHPDTQRSVEQQQSIEVYPAEQLLKDETVFGKAMSKIQKTYDSRITKCASDDQKRKEHLEEQRDLLLEFAGQGTNLPYLEHYISYFYENHQYIWDYMEHPLIMIDDPDRVHETVCGQEREKAEGFKTMLDLGQAIPEDMKSLSGEKEYAQLFNRDGIFLFTPFQSSVKGVDTLAEIRNVLSKPTPVFHGKLELLESELKNYKKKKYRVTIVCTTEERLTNMEHFLDRAGLRSDVTLALGNLTGGSDFPEEKVCYIWDGDIFGTPRKRKRKKRATPESGQVIKSFADMQKGDYVVHENHGLGKFLGLEQLTVQNVKKDYLKIKYSGEDLLYVPVEQMDVIQKYIGADVAAPKLNKLAGSEWKVTKAKAKAAIANMAKELLEVSAAREIEEGYSFSPDTVWQREFEDSFPYTETDDQLRCTEEIKADMEKNIPMDRLLCGDVGFGKTEVAARAMFKCVAEGKQAAILAPTTILANQHYYTLKERFEKFPFTVEMLSRFRTENQQSKVVDGLKKGQVDVVIGTHRLLSKDIEFKDLGLLVIDEEQRFGVRHKEVIKQLRKNVDVLALSATPIPRTLHMSLTGIKNMSLIEEPPEDRYPIQTYVLEQDDLLIKEAIEKELDRGGQVYVVYNRVQGINRIATHVAKLVPEAEVVVGHGQMNERQLEDVVLDFVQGESNVLVATTIIESGIDIPNVNTILILEADFFGLSQLYQLRGRVGRSNRMAYAYLMFRREKSLSEVAEKRLKAIKDFTEFGSGFKVAMRDLEIRGAGNLLGTQQHGHMMNIGYELYCKLVDDAVRALAGEIVNPDREATAIELKVTALIPESYIPDQVVKLQMYKRIAAIQSEEDQLEVIDELIDRFGDIPKETMNLIQISRIRSAAEQLDIVRIHESGSKVIFHFEAGTMLKPEALSNLAQTYGHKLFIHGGAKPFLRYSPGGQNSLEGIMNFLNNALENSKSAGLS